MEKNIFFVLDLITVRNAVGALKNNITDGMHVCLFLNPAK